ncbi:hypothetical protein [Streptomyces sp. NBC_01190]|uniref:hypothetical protein n=1 Tax=Streptomyces sp. NBC_01190 TaxID=2903767 RepID=UPI00386817DF|nr:hypothetical protein OG519_17780 [Streptomyces sp. NBC_01190]
MTTAPAPPRHRRSVAGFRRIAHCPTTPEEFLLGTVSPGDGRFALTDQLPRAELPFEGPVGHTLDLHYVTEAMHSVAALAARRIPGLPGLGALTAVRAGVTIEGGELWRRTRKPGHATMELRLRGSFPSAEPASLRCDACLFIEDIPYATAYLLLHGAGGDIGDGGDIGAGVGLSAERTPGRTADRPSPSQVGRHDARNVVLAAARLGADRELRADIAPDPANAAFDPAMTGRARTALVAEATRQAAVLAAGEVHGFLPAHCVPTHWSAELPFSGARQGLPTRCRAVLGPVVRDAHGRPATTVEISLWGQDAPVGTVTVTVVQDC